MTPSPGRQRIAYGAGKFHVAVTTVGRSERKTFPLPAVVGIGLGVRMIRWSRNGN